jgi:ATP-binding cassette subfamily B protein
MVEVRKIFKLVGPYWKLAVISVVTLLLMVVCDLSIPRLIEHIIDQGIKQNNMNVVLQTSAVMLAI